MLKTFQTHDWFGVMQSQASVHHRHYTCQQASCMHRRVPITKCLWQVDCFFSLSSIASTVHTPNESLLWPYFANFTELAVCFAFEMNWSTLIIQPCSLCVPSLLFYQLTSLFGTSFGPYAAGDGPSALLFLFWHSVINPCRDKRFFYSKISS